MIAWWIRHPVEWFCWHWYGYSKPNWWSRLFRPFLEKHGAGK